MKTDVVLPEEPQNERTEGSPKPAPAVRLGNPKKSAAESSPFQKAKAKEKRLKLFIWGDSGAGKTTLALQFYKPVVIDLEGGCDLYGEAFDFEVLKATTADEVLGAVNWLLSNQHPHRTLVIDPITIYWDALQKKWSDIFLSRNKGGKGHKFEFYDLQPKDWMTLKAEFKEFIRKLIALDMNVIVTARQKTQYADGAFMKAIGDTFDGEKSLPYLFDTIVRLHVDEKGRHMGTCLKDRSNKLPKEPFEAKYGLFESLFGKETLARKAKPIAPPALGEIKARIRVLIEQLGLTSERVAKGLVAYGASTLDDLTLESAEAILKKLEAVLASKNPMTNTGGNSHA
ncbi:MAG: AAA family ATPase [Elusimicrobia bacterium]|nr:AAA family ATPase [Elusimicrobiota bacterium]